MRFMTYFTCYVKDLHSDQEQYTAENDALKTFSYSIKIRETK